MRIIGGSLRGRRLVDWEEEDIRPVRDFVRTALFSIASDFVPEAVCLDLFAGVGTLGLEALSRGARSCLFVDDLREACGIIRRNLDELGLLGVGEVFEGDWEDAIDRYGRRGRRFDLVFVDPPYFQGLAVAALSKIAGAHLVTDDPLVVAAVHKTEDPGSTFGRLALADRRRYGDNVLYFYRSADATVDEPSSGR